MSLRGARQCEAVLTFRPAGKSLSTELWILLGLRLRLEGGGVGSAMTGLGLS